MLYSIFYYKYTNLDIHFISGVQSNGGMKCNFVKCNIIVIMLIGILSITVDDKNLPEKEYKLPQIFLFQTNK